MSGHEEFAAAIDGLGGLEERRPQYRHDALEVYAGTVDDGSTGRAVELRAVPAGSGAAVEDAFSEVVQAWWSVSDVDGVVDLLRWGLEPRPWALIADGGEETLATAWETVDDAIATDTVTAVGEALSAASAEGVTHGNLRPAHVRLTGGEPAALVDDWGLGRAVAEAAGGTVVTGFTAPEQLEGSTADGGAVDTYGLAALAYFALTERPPFPEDRAAILGERPQPVSAFRPELPDAVDDLVMRGLRRDPDERPDGPGAFAAEFGETMAGGGTAAGGAAAGGAAAGGAAGGAAAGSTGAGAGTDAPAGDGTVSDDGTASGAGKGAGHGSAGDGAAGGAGGGEAGGAAAGGAAGTGDTAGGDPPDSPAPEEPLAESEPLAGDDAGLPGDEDAGPLGGDEPGPLDEDDPGPLGEDDPSPLGGDDAGPSSEDDSTAGGRVAPERDSQLAEPTPGDPSPPPGEPSAGEPSPHGPSAREAGPETKGGVAEPYPGTPARGRQEPARERQGQGRQSATGRG